MHIRKSRMAIVMSADATTSNRARPSAGIVLNYNDVVLCAMASQITSLAIVYSTVYSGTDQRKYQSSASLAFVRGIHRWLVNSPRKGPVTRKMIPIDDVIMDYKVVDMFNQTCLMISQSEYNLRNVATFRVSVLMTKRLIGYCQYFLVKLLNTK